ncbi:PTS glucitol/sorbitol transporter subunit IIA [Clostridium lacusfryxellense]|uniref:PTS glucitol/sorbitol transporter subunit IIA n=1 Tax=Clostridium lacusfryxellense TaxID=205328 RepID=UPI001C0CCDEC|nr:PTS glucitol/sorbitol transporter subunit IIA [Clostridium lacusfryxellense]MBU3112223.1 PTS glucitol/sorbitol transporter subunit IIA [Clostridium lacusfryxellense]
MDIIYKTEVTYIGKRVKDFIKSDMFIIFKENAPEDLKDYCFLHNKNELTKNIEVDDNLFLGETQYKITAVGEYVNKNLKELGHITFKFSGETEANIAGTLFLEKKEIVPPENGTIIKILRR